jgi:hypothetical protein
MNTNANTEPQAVDDLDRLLGSYFKQQLPHPWPQAPSVSLSTIQPATATTSTMARPGDSLKRSRLVLAASVAILLGGCWLLSGQLSNGKARTNNPLENGTANTKYLKDLGKAPGK